MPVHFAEEEPGYLYVHFLPKNKVEVWSVNKEHPISPNYPGPAYPHSRPGPDYASPLDDKRIDKKGQL